MFRQGTDDCPTDNRLQSMPRCTAISPETGSLRTDPDKGNMQDLLIPEPQWDTCQTMKILLINTYSQGGGAAVAARRLLDALRKIGVEARMLVAVQKHTVGSEVITPYRKGTLGRYRWQMNFVRGRLRLLPHVGYDRSRLFRYSTDEGYDISEHPWVKWADAIHLHWVQHSFLSLEGIEALVATRKPILWSLHDLWAITGGCHIPHFTQKGVVQHCTKFHTHCDLCPLLGSKQSGDLSWMQYERKRQIAYDRIHFLAVSHAVAQEVNNACLSQRSTVSVLPNMIDPEIFYPAPKVSNKEFRILFVAARPDDPVKGLNMCKEMLEIACKRSEEFAKNAIFTCIGTPKDNRILDDFPIGVERIGTTTSTKHLVSLYNSSRLTLSTSIFETFGQTLLESIACGTPALAFGVGGITDIIREGENGYIAPPYDTSKMAERLLHLFEHPDILADKQAISRTASPFYADVVANQAKEIYYSLLSK